MGKIDPRLMTLSEAAAYCRLSIATFKALCPVSPVLRVARKILYDKLDLDKWIESHKSENASASENEWDAVLRK